MTLRGIATTLSMLLNAVHKSSSQSNGSKSNGAFGHVQHICSTKHTDSGIAALAHPSTCRWRTAGQHLVPCQRHRSPAAQSAALPGQLVGRRFTAQHAVSNVNCVRCHADYEDAPSGRCCDLENEEVQRAAAQRKQQCECQRQREVLVPAHVFVRQLCACSTSTSGLEETTAAAQEPALDQAACRLRRGSKRDREQAVLTSLTLVKAVCCRNGMSASSIVGLAVRLPPRTAVADAMAAGGPATEVREWRNSAPCSFLTIPQYVATGLRMGTQQLRVHSGSPV